MLPRVCSNTLISSRYPSKAMESKPVNSRRLLGAVIVSLFMLALLDLILRDIQFSEVWNNIQPGWVVIGLLFYLAAVLEEEEQQSALWMAAHCSLR